MKYFIVILLCLSLHAKSSESEDIKELYESSYSYEHIQKYDEAIKVLSPLYEKYPKGYTLNLRFGWLFYLNKRYKDSIKYYKIATLVKPYSLEAKLGLVSAYLESSSYEDAYNVCEHIMKIDYYNYYANLYISKALIAQKKYDVAADTINKMLLLYPTDVAFLQQLAVVYKATGSEHLQESYRDILTLDPNNVYVRSNLK